MACDYCIQLGLVCSDRPEGRVLSCLDSSSTQAVSALCVRGSSISVQGPTLRAGPVSPRLHESRGGSPCSHERTGHPHPQLSRRLAHSRSVSGTVMRTQGFGAQSPQPVGPSGQLGKEQTRPSAEDLFSRYGVGFGRTVSTPHRGTCSVGVELPEYFQGQDSGPTETFSEAPGAYGGRSGSNRARLASYETASALASWPSPEMGVATRHVSSGNHSGMPPNLQPMVRPLVSSGRSSPRAGVPSQVCVSPSEPTCTDLVQSQGGRGAGLASCALLAQPDLVPGTHAPRDSPSLASSSEKGPSFSETGHPLAPASRPLETPCLVPGRDAEVLGDLPPEVLNTIASARALSTRRAYALKWNLFVKWCSSRREDPRRCSISVVLSFLQQGLERRLSPSTLKVHAAAISAYHDHIDGKSIGKHDLVVRFLRGARRLNPPRPPSIPSWDLALVLRALQIAPFEPLQSADLRILSMKTLLLVALASIKRVGDLQAFSVDESCLEFGPGDGQVLLSPQPGYVPKVPTTPFRDQVVSLQALPLEEADPALALLCPVRALRLYTDRTQSLRTSDQLFVCYGGQQKGKAVSKQRMAHWIVDAIALAYQAQGVPCPLRLRAHSTRGVASSWALARGASLTDICRAAGWATPNTFARFYSLRVEPVSSRVLTSGQRHGEVPA